MIWILLGAVFSEQNPYSQAMSNKDVEFKDAINEGCTAMNTYALPDGKCACTEGFPHGDPMTSRGCFKCTEACSASATCIYPGKCRCKSGFTGNGIECEAPVPVLRFIEPDSIPINIKGKVNATIIIDVPIENSTGNCRFGKTITDGRMVTNNIMECVLPPNSTRILGSVGFSVSLDNVSWSKEYVMFTFEEPIQNSVCWARYVLIVCGSVLIVIALYLIFKTEPAQEDEDDAETTPFKQSNDHP